MRPTRPGRKRGSTETVVAARVQEVLYLRLNGAEFHDLAGHAKEHKWRVSERQLWRYVEAADELLARTQEKDREKLLRRHLAQRRGLYARALQDGDHRTALAVLRDEAEMLGLYPAKNVKVSGDPEAPLAVTVEALTDDERRAALERIAARYGLAAAGTGGRPADRDGPADGDGPLLG